MKRRMGLMAVGVLIAVMTMAATAQAIRPVPGSGTTEVGLTIDIPVVLEPPGLAELYSMDLWVEFDPAFLEVVSIDPSDKIRSLGPITNVVSGDAVDYVAMAAASLNPTTDVSELVVIRFQALKKGVTQLRIKKSHFDEATGQNDAIGQVIVGPIPVESETMGALKLRW